MVELQNALKIAKEHFAKSQQEITKAYEADEMWIVYGGRIGQSKIGGAAITISKKDGQIGKFLLPSKKNFAILVDAKQIDIGH